MPQTVGMPPTLHSSPTASWGQHWHVEEPGVADAEGIARVHNTTWEHAYQHLLPPSYWDAASLRHRIDNWTDLLARTSPEDLGRAFRVGRTADGTIVGFATLRLTGECDLPLPELHALYVLPGYHGTGLAHELVRQLLGDGPAFLWVAADNPRARAFYTKLGFTPDGTEKHDPRIEGLHEVRLVRGA